MPRPEPTEIRIDETGTETHESWLLIRADHVSSSPGAELFDSEISHMNLVRVTVSRCRRRRDLHRDWRSAATQLIEFDMSQAQWGAFVSSFGNGDGVPATLTWFDGAAVPGVSTHDSRLEKSHQEVLDAATEALADVREAYSQLKEAVDTNAGKRDLRERLRALEIQMDNLPETMKFAATSLTEHVENVVTKARGDIEAMASEAVRRGVQLDAAAIAPRMIEGDL